MGGWGWGGDPDLGVIVICPYKLKGGGWVGLGGGDPDLGVIVICPYKFKGVGGWGWGGILI